MDSTAPMLNAALAAANWWAQQVGAPTFDNGDDGIAGALASMVAEARPVAPGSVTAFVPELASTVREHMHPKYGVTLSVDYGPEGLLAEVAQAAGVPFARFPWKTRMSVHDQYVTASRGYRAPTVLVWASEEWLAHRPTCDRQKWDEARQDQDYNGDPWACSQPLYHDGPCVFDRAIVLCGVCGSRDGWYHDAEQRGHMPDFHAFVGQS